ncbi:hypothetical protein ACLOJK_008063 [Asimina triloba]
MKRGANRSLGALKRALVIKEGVREREGCAWLGSKVGEIDYRLVDAVEEERFEGGIRRSGEVTGEKKTIEISRFFSPPAIAVFKMA